MKAHLLRLLSGTFIYGGGALVSRFITFLLLPLTTAYLMPEDYGVIGTLATTSQILNGLFTLGFGVSMVRCYWSTNDTEERTGLIWVVFATLSLNALLLITLGTFFSEKISGLLLNSHQYSYSVFLTFISLGLTSACLPFANYLRIQEKASLVVCMMIGEVIIMASTMIFFVVYLDRHAQGVIEAGVIGQIFTFFCSLIIAIRELRLIFKWNYLRELLTIGYPYIFGLFGYFLMLSSSRYILQIYSNLDEVGLLFMGTNFARAIEMVVGGFISAWPPFFASFVNKQEEGARIFSKVLSYYVIGMCCLLVIFFTLAKPIVLLMVHPRYYDVWKVIGILATSWALWGVYSISATGFIFYKKSLWQMITEIGGGLSSIALSFLLIPYFQKEGAAIATVLSFFILISVSFFLNNLLFPVEYEVKRIVKTALALFFAALITFIPIDSLSTYNGLMVIDIVLFFTYIWFYCLTPDEKKMILEYLPTKSKSGVVA